MSDHRYVRAVEGGTLMRETWGIRSERNRRPVSGLGEQTEQAMAATLDRIEELLGAGGAAA